MKISVEFQRFKMKTSIRLSVVKTQGSNDQVARKVNMQQNSLYITSSYYTLKGEL